MSNNQTPEQCVPKVLPGVSEKHSNTRTLSDVEWQEYLTLFSSEDYENDDDPSYPCERNSLVIDENGNILCTEELPQITEQDQKDVVTWLRSIWEK